MYSACLPVAVGLSPPASRLLSWYLKVVFSPQDPFFPALSWLQAVTVGCGSLPSLGCSVVLCTQGVLWQLWTQLPTGYHLAQRMGDLYPMGFPKGQPTCRGLFHPPAHLLSLSCQGGNSPKVAWAATQDSGLLGIQDHTLALLKMLREAQGIFQPS